MSEPFLAEIRIVSFGFAPRGWAFCDGQLLPISQNQAVFALLGTTYGGDGRVNFALPNMKGRAPVHRQGSNQGEAGGEAAHTLTAAEVQHTHPLNASINQATTTSPTGNVLAAKKRGGKDEYQVPPGVPLAADSVSTAQGNGQPHNNMQPYLVLNFIIALQGIFPSQN